MRSRDLITLNDSKCLASESYKMFRSNLCYMNVDDDKQVIMFTSSLAEEGKTTSISNAAISFAQDGKKTLLIECDLRKARAHSVFNVPQVPGLTNILVHHEPLENVVNNIEEEPLLDVLTAGPLPPSPAELLGSKALEKLIEEARKHYDKILVDAPPVLSVTDTVVLNRLVDGVVLVVAAGDTHKDTVRKALKALNKIEVNLLGALISKMDVKRSSYYDYYRYGYTYGDDRMSRNPLKHFFKRKKELVKLKEEDMTMMQRSEV